MITSLFRLHLYPGKRDELVGFLKWDKQVAEESEPGTLRFDFYDDPENPGDMYLYESYTDQAAFDEHKANAPFKKFIAEVRPNCIESADTLLGWVDELGIVFGHSAPSPLCVHGVDDYLALRIPIGDHPKNRSR